ncbi:MAG: DUF882 domain-containing protein [Deltaproteobacteria bacterium]|nr:DUF882 domain-containing protein [Deltaproteobacteria bacterium]MCW5804575.1 DUF882 domain-containing protein [Deltaproteobacteria bacterium]
MFAALLHFKLATTTLAGWMTAQSPMPTAAPVLALLVEAEAQSPIEVSLYDGNYQVETRVLLERDGSADADTVKKMAFAFRARGGSEKPLSPKLLSMVADLATQYGRPIEFMSAYRSGAWEGPHYAARALDFRIQGVDLRTVRDYLWAKYSEIGLGWYPTEQFLHLDSRPGIPDCAWTFLNGKEHYHPHWEVTARQGVKRERHRPGS